MSIIDLPTAREERLPPDPGGVGDVFRRIGYKLDEALADIIDNSIDAGADNVIIRYIRNTNQVSRIMIADDGRGMSESELHRAMQYGVRSGHKSADLGKYGIGLKSASFSQGRSVAVLSRKGGKSAGRRWTAKSVKDDWRLQVIPEKAAAKYLNGEWKPLDTTKSGTIVVWDELEGKGAPPKLFEKSHAKLTTQLAVDLGLRFHRFIESGRVRLLIETTYDPLVGGDTQLDVMALDPFAHPKSGRKGYPVSFVIQLGSAGNISADAHIWPAKSKNANYLLGGGKVSQRQGFYFYRNDRLISAGGWHGLRGDAEPHTSLARVRVDVPPDLDSLFRLTVQKDDFLVPQEFFDGLKDARAANTTFQQYLEAAEEVYRNAPRKRSDIVVPAGGIPARVSRQVADLLCSNADSSTIEVNFEWDALPEDEVFEIDRDEQVIYLNSLYRNNITAGINSKADAPAFKITLFFALREAVAAKRLSSARKEELDALNHSLLLVFGIR